CAGGTLRSLEMGAGGIDLAAQITFPGATHSAVVKAPEGFTLKIVDAEDPSVVYLDVALAAERFTSTAKSTTYDGMGTFDGSIRLVKGRGQRDSVLLKLSTDNAPALAVPATADLRVFLSGGELCARTCVSSCAAQAGTLSCESSADYVPFADYGFGQLRGGNAPPSGVASPLCGLDVRPGGPRCDFLIPEQCLMPYPSS